MATADVIPKRTLIHLGARRDVLAPDRSTLHRTVTLAVTGAVTILVMGATPADWP
jgi:hypothetical protein